MFKELLIRDIVYEKSKYNFYYDECDKLIRKKQNLASSLDPSIVCYYEVG